MDTGYQAGTEGLTYAAKKGLAVVIMEPIAGGRLAIEPPAPIKQLWKEGHHRWKPAEWALQWVWNHPEVSLVLSGMSNMEQTVENVKAAGRSGVGKLTKEDIKLVDQVAKKYREMGFVGCTGCRYCTPCPSGVAIPEIFSLFNEYYMKDRDNAVKAKYSLAAQEGAVREELRELRAMRGALPTAPAHKEPAPRRGAGLRVGQVANDKLHNKRKNFLRLPRPSRP